MSRSRCLNCHAALRRSAKSIPTLPVTTRQAYSTKPPTSTPKVDIDDLLSANKWSWSVKDLLPQNTSKDSTTTSITTAQLHHLCRLSALPPPQTPKEESQMLTTLESQLHFVREIQNIDTTGVEPLVSIKDETIEGIAERTMGLHTPAIREALANEEFKGRNRRPRRRRGEPVDTRGSEEWDVMGLAERKQGEYFVVDSSKGEQ